MKYALITEDQIRAIEDALNGDYSGDVDKALAIVKSLKMQEPALFFGRVVYFADPKTGEQQ